MEGTPAPGAAPTFSVVTIVLNDEAGLRATMANIRSQTFRDFEWIIVDGGSRDGVPDLLRSGASGAQRWVTEKDRGVYDAMQKGTDLARGRFVVYMNAGDSFSGPEVLSVVAAHIGTAASGVDVVFGGATLILPNGRRHYRAPRNIERVIWRSLPANHQATYFSRKALLATPYDTHFRIAGDYALVAMMYRANVAVSYLDTSLVDFRVGDLSSRHPWRLLREGALVQRRVLHLSRTAVALSFARRAISIFGLRFMSSPAFARVNDE